MSVPRRSALWLVALAPLLGGGALAGCSREPNSTPEATLAAFVAAMQASRSDVAARRRAYELLAARARASLVERAARASQLSGRDIHPWEMLAPGRFTLRFAIDPESLTSRIEGSIATVIARGPAGEVAEVPLVREDGRWRVELVLPPMLPIHIEADAAR